MKTLKNKEKTGVKKNGKWEKEENEKWKSKVKNGKVKWKMEK